MDAFNLRYCELFSSKKQIENEMKLIIEELNVKRKLETDKLLNFPIYDIKILLEVSNDVFQQHILQYLTIKDIGSFDNAMINRSYRNLYQQKISNILMLDTINIRSKSSLCWLDKRNIRIKKIVISGMIKNVISTNIINIDMIFQYCEDLSVIETVQDIDSIMDILVYCRSLKSLNLKYGNGVLTSDHIRFILTTCKGLQTLKLNGTFADNSNIDLSEYCSGILNLVLSGSMIYLPQYCKRLQTLDISNCKNLRDERLTSLIAQNCTELQTLNLGGCTALFDASIISIAEHCPGLLSLNLSECVRISDDSIMSIAEHCTGLLSLNLGRCSNITDDSIISIAEHCTGLQSLNLKYCMNISDTSIKTIAKHCTGLQSLNLRQSGEISDASIITIAKHCKSLKTLKLDCESISDAPIISLIEHNTRLQSLSLDYTQHLSDASIISIAMHCKGLQELYLHDCGIKITETSILFLVHNCRRLKKFEISPTSDNLSIGDMPIEDLKNAIEVLLCSNK